MKTVILSVLMIAAFAGCGRNSTRYPCFGTGLSAGETNFFVVWNVELPDRRMTCCQASAEPITAKEQFKAEFAPCTFSQDTAGNFQMDCSAFGSISQPYTPPHASATACEMSDLNY